MLNNEFISKNKSTFFYYKRSLEYKEPEQYMSGKKYGQFGDIPFFRRPIVPTAHYSDDPLFRQHIIPTNYQIYYILHQFIKLH